MSNVWIVASCTKRLCPGSNLRNVASLDSTAFLIEAEMMDMQTFLTVFKQWWEVGSRLFFHFKMFGIFLELFEMRLFFDFIVIWW